VIRPGPEIYPREARFAPRRITHVSKFRRCSNSPQSGHCPSGLLNRGSGKGLRAAMTVALAIGALRTLAAEDLRPAALLQRLNLQILSAEDGGFVTCLCAEISRDGAVTAANAGHLSPYLNGVEVALGSGLPLGLTAEAGYTEATLQLAPGDMLTLLSDGVVEARNITGELFGFERTCAISAQSAQQIAEAGQEDDITVLTLTFAGAEVLQA
jgi:serine phosphatase RsbU (regulator of sigma subunit)